MIHLFPKRTNKAQCGEYGIMTHEISDVTCKECIVEYLKKLLAEIPESHKTKPEETNGTNRTDCNHNSGNDAGGGDIL